MAMQNVGHARTTHKDEGDWGYEWHRGRGLKRQLCTERMAGRGVVGYVPGEHKRGRRWAGMVKSIMSERVQGLCKVV